MKILVSNQSELPIYAQIKEQIKEQILNGQILEGTVLPSIRMLAKEIGVSVITTTRAYNDLEKEGYISSMQGKGSIVLSKENKILKEQYLVRIEQGLFTAVETAKRIEMTEAQVHNLISQIWKGMMEE
ncbi:GntR family transcriptional regulator [Lachnotalea glycerini]|uniref:GntR family transcriptional regulator n=1 Tax=Lachnotalea glycerini TaxID=1763509 RepID=A0A318EXP9_9FIRM|nr:GntR family transcriptional regulator [Lachnotalea glycerini]PXV91592.1 GntR family transcriptional regulator [Lachnotalea glycerini]